MTNELIRRARIATGFVVACCACAGASALDFTFSQGGFAEGATVSGSFSGEDTDGNGFINHFPFDGLLEVSAFSLSFSGNSLVEAFSLGLADLQMFSFMLGGDGEVGNDLGDVFADPYAVEGIFAFDGRFSFAAGLGPLGQDGAMIDDLETFGSDASDENPSARTPAPPPTSVPDAGSSAAFLGAAALAFFAVRRKMAPIER